MRKVGRNFINKVEIKVELWNRAWFCVEMSKIYIDFHRLYPPKKIEFYFCIALKYPLSLSRKNK